MRLQIKSSGEYYKAYVVVLKVKKHWLWRTKYLDDEPIFWEVTGGQGWEKLQEAYQSRTYAEKAAKQQAKEMGCDADSSFRPNIRGEMQLAGG